MMPFAGKRDPPSPKAFGTAESFGDAVPEPAARPALLHVPTIFHEPWWLSAASGGTYEEVTVSSGGLVVGRLPYVRRRIAGQTILTMPAMTHVLGPALSPDISGSKVQRLSREISLTAALIEQLPRAAHIWFRLHGGTRSTLAFEAAGFSNAANFTVEIQPASGDALWQNVRSKTRNIIRRAGDYYSIITLDEASHFLDFYDSNLRQRSLRNHYNQACCKKVIAACLQHDAGRILAAVNPAGKLEAAVFTVWDHHTEYYFMSTRVPQSLSGASSLLTWTALQEAAAKGRVFDADMIHVVDGKLPNLTLLTGYGGDLRPRYHVRRSSAFLQTLRHFRHLSGRLW